MLRAVKLKEGEELLLVVRQTLIAFSSSILIGLFLFLLPFFLLFPLFSLGGWGVFLFFLLLLAAMIFAFFRFVDWYFNCGVITTARVIDIHQKGLFERVISEIPYYKIDDVSCNIKGIKQALFRYGSVVVAIRGYRSSIVFRNVKNPTLIQELILEVERCVKGWDKTADETASPEKEELSEVEKNALSLALQKIKKVKGKGKDNF